MSSSQHLSNSILDTRLQSSSCQDLSNNNLHNSSSFLGHNNNNHLIAADAHERERLKAMLPTYRPAPDYETAVQLKYRAPSSELYNLNQLQYQAAALAAHNTAAAYYAGSQPDVHQAGEGLILGHMATHRYPDVAQPAQAMHAQYTAAGGVGGGSTQGNNVYVDVSQRLQMIRTKPPPPYPVNRLSSSSTPDLAVASHRPLLGYRAYVSGSSPDLVSNRNLLNSQYQYPGGGGGIAGGGGQITTSSGATMLHQYPYMGHMGHSQSYLPPHGTFENLNMIEEQPSIMSQLRQSAMSQAAVVAANQTYEQNSPTLPPSGYRASSASQQQQSTQPAVLQRNAMNGSIEPIYENVPLPQYQSSTSVTPQRNTEQRSSGSSNHNSSNNHNEQAMRNRTSSIQSAPGGMHNQQPPVPAVRHHHIQQRDQPTPTLQQQYMPDEPDEISMNIKKFNHQTQPDRAASTEMQLLDPLPPQRAMRAASAAPAIGQTTGSSSQEATPVKMTPPPRQHRNMKNSSSVSAVDVMQATSTPSSSNSAAMNSSRITSSLSHDDSLNQQFSTLNLSSNSSSMYNSTLDSTIQSNSTVNSTTTKQEKRKKRWNFLGRSKTPDKQKSATLGREKASTTAKLQKIKLAQDDLNIHHRWSTGVPKLQPISGQFSKDKLVRNFGLNQYQI